MLDLNFPLGQVITTTSHAPKDTGWPTPSPFDLRFSMEKLSVELRTALSGSGVYLISYGEEVIYIGMYRPSRGRIVDDRWKRHLQTITARGFNIGLGGKHAETRRSDCLAAVEHPDLRAAINHAYCFSQVDRYRDSGFTTTPNRLRFASENWDTFRVATPETILLGFNFWLYKIRVPTTTVDARSKVKDIETDVLRTYRPLCNDEYKHARDFILRKGNTVEAMTAAIFRAAKERTHQGITHQVCLYA